MDDVTTEAPVEAMDQPVEVTSEAPPEGTSADEARFTDLDPTEAPEGEFTPEWLQERYKQMQADYTRKRQADSETAQQRGEELEFLESLRSDRETQQAVLEQLQEILNESEVEGETEGEAPVDPIMERLGQLEQIENQRRAESIARQVHDHIEQLAKDANVSLDEDDVRDLFNRAVAGEQVNNDSTAGAFKAWNDRRQAQEKKWLESYLASKTPGTSQLPAGTSATEAPDLSNSEGRIARMAAILQGGS